MLSEKFDKAGKSILIIGVIATILSFIQNPESSLVLYSLIVTLIGFVLLFASTLTIFGYIEQPINTEKIELTPAKRNTMIIAVIIGVVSFLLMILDFDAKGTRGDDSISKTISQYEAKRLAEDFIDSNGMLHGTMGLDYYSNLSNPEQGKFTFYGSVCYGSSEYDCNYVSAYLVTTNNGRSWSIKF